MIQRCKGTSLFIELLLMFDNITKVPIDFNFPYFSFPLIMNHHTVLHTFDIKRFRLTLDGTV